MSRVAAAGLIAIALLLVLAAAQAEKPEPKAVGNVTEIMKAMVIPSSNAIWNVGRNPPAADAAWEALKSYSVLLGESGNLLLIGGRAKDDEVWRSTSLTMVEAGVLALTAAKAKNVDGINDAGNLIVDACELCHERHWQR
jgi:cytochrome c556